MDMERSQQQKSPTESPPPPSPSSSSSSVSADTVLPPPGKRRRAATTAKAKAGAKPKRARKDAAAAADPPPPPAAAAAGKRSSVYRGVTRYARISRRCMPSIPAAAPGSCIAAKFASLFDSFHRTFTHSRHRSSQFRSHLPTPAPLYRRLRFPTTTTPPDCSLHPFPSFLHPAIALDHETFSCTHACHTRRRRQSLLVPPLVDRTRHGWRGSSAPRFSFVAAAAAASAAPQISKHRFQRVRGRSKTSRFLMASRVE